MQLTDYIIELGRVVAYYPSLKRVTNSTVASILLCQLLYWTPKSKDKGWIWKTSGEIEEETGLTYNEQRTARKVLKELDLVKEEYKRLDHTNRFKVNEPRLNELWEQATGERVTPIENPNALKGTQLPLIEVGEKEKKSRKPTKAEIKKEEKERITTLVEKKLKIIATNKRWQGFIEFAWKRQEENQEKVESFLDYAIREGFNPIYWTPEKMQTLWPQAFISSQQEDEPFVKPTYFEKKDVEYAPMPTDLRRAS